MYIMTIQTQLLKYYITCRFVNWTDSYGVLFCYA